MKLSKLENIIVSDKLPNSDKIYIGIDQSLACTSIAVLYKQEISLFRIKPLYMGVSRISEIYDAFEEILEWTKTLDGELEGVAIEGYAYSATGAKFNLGELGGVLRLALYKRSIRTVEVPPTYLKKFVTGKGNSPKNVMMKELYKKYNVDVDDDNDCDAIGLSAAAFDYLDTEFHPIKTYRTDTHKSCKLIVGEHPKPLDHKEYFAGMPDVTVAEYEKIRKQKKKELNSE